MLENLELENLQVDPPSSVGLQGQVGVASGFQGSKTVDLGSLRSGCISCQGRDFDLELIQDNLHARGQFYYSPGQPALPSDFSKIRNKVNKRGNIGRFFAFYMLQVPFSVHL